MHIANTDVTFCDEPRIKNNQTRRKDNAQEPIQSNSSSCPRHQMGKENIQLIRTARAESQEEMATALS